MRRQLPTLRFLTLHHSNRSITRDIRQVPDTQEVFLYPDSSVSIIVEILQRIDPPDFRDAAK